MIPTSLDRESLFSHQFSLTPTSLDRESLFSQRPLNTSNYTPNATNTFAKPTNKSTTSNDFS